MHALCYFARSYTRFSRAQRAIFSCASSSLDSPTPLHSPSSLALPSSASPGLPRVKSHTRTLIGTTPSTTRAVEDVVAAHCQKNRTPRLPSNSQLAIIRQQQSSIPSRSCQTTSTNIAASHNNPDAPHIEDQQEITQPRVGRTVERTDRSEPWQIQFYDLAVCDILERAKQFSYCDAASVNTFPLLKTRSTSIDMYVD